MGLAGRIPAVSLKKGDFNTPSVIQFFKKGKRRLQFYKFPYYKNKSLTTAVRLSKSSCGFYLIISNIVAISSVAIDTFDFSIKIFPPVIMYDGITLIPL